MVIYLQHATHGTKVAVSEDEAKADEALGWKRFAYGLQEVAEAVEVNEAVVPMKRRGRPPKAH